MVTPKKPFTVTPAKAKEAYDQALKFLEVGDWTPATPIHLVALYLWCHHTVYGVIAGEVQGKEYAIAAKTAKDFLQIQFEGDINKCVSFIRWTWKREEEREQWRRSNNQQGKRIGWRLQFSPSLVTDYKLAMARAVPHVKPV